MFIIYQVFWCDVKRIPLPEDNKDRYKQDSYSASEEIQVASNQPHQNGRDHRRGSQQRNGGLEDPRLVNGDFESQQKAGQD